MLIDMIMLDSCGNDQALCIHVHGGLYWQSKLGFQFNRPSPETNFASVTLSFQKEHEIPLFEPLPVEVRARFPGN